jgi:CRP-like cAMP-binding protein
VAHFATDSDEWIAELARRVHGADRAPRTSDGRDRLDVIGKAFLLQRVDLLEGARSSHLSLLATISQEIEADAGEVLIRPGEPNDALYVIVRGSVELSGVGDHTLNAEDGTAFGTWSLIDSAPSVVGARATERTRLLRITRSDFQELLSDHPELATGMLQALARRLRSLVA